MSDYYTFSLDFTLRRDTPAPLLAALRATTRRERPRGADLAALPPLVAAYLGAGFPAEGPEHDLWHYRLLTPLSQAVRPEQPDDPAHRFQLHQTFHDDEFWNGGMYLIWWLFQFSAQEGYLGTETLEFSAPPTIWTRVGGEILQTELAYDPFELSALGYREQPLDAVNPIAITRTLRTDLAQMLGDIAFMADAE